MKKLMISLLCVVMMVAFMPSMAFASAPESGVNDGAGQIPKARELQDGEGVGPGNGTPVPESEGETEHADLGTDGNVSGVVSDEDAVVKMTQGEVVKNYMSVGDALEDVADYTYPENKTEYVITLQKNTQEDIVIPANKKIKIDLNGYKITNETNHTIYNHSSRITIVDTKGGGVVDNITNGKAAVYNNINAEITMNGGTFMRSAEASKNEDENGGNSYYVIKNFGSLTVNSGVNVKFSDSNVGLYSSLIGNGWQDAAAAEEGRNGEPKPSGGGNKATLKVSGGTFTGGQITIKNDDYGLLTVSGGTIIQPSAGRAAIANNNTATISGGTIEAKGANGQAVYSRYFDTNGANKGELSISGGSFKSTGTVIDAQAESKLTVTDGIFETTGNGSYIFTVASPEKASIKKGTYKGVAADKVADNKDAFEDGYAPMQDADGNLTVDVTDEGAVAIVIDKTGVEKKYVSLSAALSAAKAGSTVKLQKGVVLEKGVKTASGQQDITLDLNGYSINGETVNTADGVVCMKPGYGWKPTEGFENKMSIINSRPEQGGEIKGKLPLSIGSGDSRYTIAGEIGDGVKLTTLDEESNAVKLESGAYLLYNDTAKDLIKNGGFKITDAQGTACIYGGYANARSSAADGIVTMLHDYKGNEAIYSGSEEGILDLGGNTYTYTSTGSAIDVNYPDVTLTIKNGKVVATNKTCDGAHLIGASNTVLTNTSQMNNRGIILDGVELTVPGEACGIVTNGTETGNKVVLKDSVLNVKEGVGIYFPSTGEVTIENSVINAKLTGVQMCAGTLSVTGEKTAITVTGQPQEKTETDGPISDGAAISIVDRDGYKELETVKVEGGTFKSADGVDAVKAYAFAGGTDSEWPEAKEVVELLGGSFTYGEKGSVLDYVSGQGNVKIILPKKDNVTITSHPNVGNVTFIAQEGTTIENQSGTEIDVSMPNGDGQITIPPGGNAVVKPEEPPTPPIVITYYDITAAQPEHGSIKLSADRIYRYGDVDVTLTAEEGYEVKDLLINGVSVGAVSSYTIEDVTEDIHVTAVFGETDAAKKARIIKGVQDTDIKLTYKMDEIGKGWIKIRWTKEKGYAVDYYEVFRSAKSKANFGKEAYFTKNSGKINNWYKNTKQIKKGTRYYYKVRGVREIDGKTYYTKWSNTTWRTGR